MASASRTFSISSHSHFPQIEFLGKKCHPMTVAATCPLAVPWNSQSVSAPHLPVQLADFRSGHIWKAPPYKLTYDFDESHISCSSAYITSKSTLLSFP
ncbi:hypothetical protein ACLKA6_001726 [Drosophila palustris]